jgi:LPS O-antigen subunit length determinant protein (WzzB/FepE family)
MSSEDLQNRYDDEIDLRDLALMLVEGWYWILGTVVVALLGAGAYLYVAIPSYSTELVFSRAADGLRNLNAIPGVNYTEEQVKQELAVRLSSYENFSRFIDDSDIGRESFILAMDDIDNEQELFSAKRKFFADNINVVIADEENSFGRVQLTYNERFAGPDFVNGYYQWSELQYRQVLAERAQRATQVNIERNERQMEAYLEAYQEQVDVRIIRMNEADKIRLAQLQDQLQAEKTSIVSSREERVRILRQAEQVAEQLGIVRPTTPRELGRQPSDREVIYAEINTQNGLPLYFMGTDALRAEREILEANLRENAKTAAIINIEKEIQQLQNNREIEALLAREDNSPFVEAYNELRQNNILLKSNVLTPDDIQVAEVISWAYQPDSPDSPRRALILALSLVLGGMLGVMLVFLARFAVSLRSYRKAKG